MALKRTLGGLIIQSLQWLWLRILVLCLMFFSLLIIPLVLPFALVIFLFRFFLFKTSRFLRPSLGKILSARSALFSCDEIYSKPLCTLIGQFHTEGPADVLKFRELILENWIRARCPKTGELKHPELSQYITRWFGFSFWKNEPKFDIEQHVVVWEGKADGDGKKEEFVSQREVCDYISELSTSPFESKTSPWLLIIIPNFRESPEISGSRSAVEHSDPEKVGLSSKSGQSSHMTIFKWHHSLTDGFGILRLFSSVAHIDLDSVHTSVNKHKNPGQNLNTNPHQNGKSEVDKQEKEVVKKRTKPSGKKKPGILAALSFILRAPWENTKVILESQDPIRSNSWHLPENRLKKQWISQFSDEFINNEMIKDIKNHFGVSFTAVLMAAIADSIRHFMLKVDPSKKIPEFIHAGIPFPMKQNEKLRNSWSICTLKLPIGGDSSALARLVYIEKKLQSLKGQTTPLVTFLLMPLVGMLFNPIMKLIMNNKNTTLILSTMPGPSKTVRNFLGQDFLPGGGFFVTLGPGNAGFGISTFSYMDLTRIGATVDLALLTDPTQVNDLANGVLNHLKLLKSLMNSQV